jgi:DNA-binding NarL/FixJ family response regulator
MSGFQFLSELRAMPAPLRDLPVILLTAHTDEAFVRKARELKVARYLLKSEMISRLDMAIRQVLSARVED